MLIAAWLGSAALGQTAPDPASDAKAHELFADGQRLYDQGRYDEAITAFQQAYDLSHRPALLYNIANADERLNRLQAAVDMLRAYRDAVPTDQPEVLEARIEAIQQRIADPIASSPPEPQLIPVPVPVPVPVPAAPVPLVPHHRSPAPWVVTTVGGVVAVAGGAVAGKTWLTSRDVLDRRDRDAWDALRPVNNAGFGSALGGGAIAVVGVVWAVAR